MKAIVENDDSLYNQDILNLITPPALEFKKTNMINGDQYAQCISINHYPTNPKFGWLSEITSIEGVTSKIEFDPTDSSELIQRCNEQIRKLNQDLSVVRDESVKQAKEKAIRDISSMIKRICEYGEVVGYVNVMLFVQAATQELLNERMKKVRSIIASCGANVRTLSFLQKEAYECIAPYGLPNEKISNFGARNMPLSTFIGGFPNSSSGINDGVGYLLGKTDRFQPIILDTWKRGGDRTNSNWVVFGIPGVGKSTTVKSIALKEYALGSKILLIDPEREYTECTRNLNGDIIDCGGGSTGKINPLQVRLVPRDEDDIEDEYNHSSHGINDLAMHFQTLRTFFRLYCNEIDPYLATLEAVLEELYANFNITWKTDISRLHNEDYPIMSDLYELICKKWEKDQENEDLQKLRKLLRSISVGADSFIWNGHTTMHTYSDFIDLDVSSLLEADEKIQKAQYFNILSWCWNEISKKRTEKIILIVEEAYLLVDPRVPQSMIFLKNTSKRIRKYEGGLIVVTHSVVDLIDPEVKRYGQPIIDNATFKLLMGCDGKNLKETKDLFNLTDSEENLLLSKQRGRGLLYVGSARISARIEVSSNLLKIMGDAGGR